MKKRYTVTLTLPDGKRKYYRGDTQEEAERKRNADKELIERGSSLLAETTFADLTDIWYKMTKAGKVHTRTEDTIKGILKRYILPELGKKQVIAIKPLDIRKLMSTVSSLSQSTQRKVLQYTKSILEIAVEDDLITKNPCVSSIKAGGLPPKEVEPLTDEQCEALLSATKGTRVYPFIMVLRFAGLRKEEALGLMWKDIDFENHLLRVRRGVVYTLENRNGVINEELKTSAAHREIPLAPNLEAVLKEEKSQSKSLYVFSMQNGRYLSEASFRRMWDLISYRKIGTENVRDLTGRTLDFDVHPHQLRHTCITAWIRAGLGIKEVQYLAGHSSVDVTLSVYTHYVRSQEFQKTAEKIKNSVPQALSV